MTAMSSKTNLTIWICETDRLREDTIKELYELWTQHVVTKLSWKDFYHGLLQKFDEVILLREPLTGTLQGFALHSIVRNKVAKDGTKYTLIPYGATFLQRKYRGSNIFYKVLIWDLIKESLLHPFTPLYTGGRVFSYRGYLMIRQMFKFCYPNYKVRVPPELEKSIMDDQARSYLEESETYDSERGIIYQEDTVVKDEVDAVLTEGMLQNPHIKFFRETNPNSQKGHQLCVVNTITWNEILRLMAYSIMLKLKSKL